MKEVIYSETFNKWFDKLKDKVAKQAITGRIFNLLNGHPGKNRFLGGISEMKISLGPGYRVYYMEKDGNIVVLLVGGDKSTQDTDIEKARKLAEFYT